MNQSSFSWDASYEAERPKPIRRIGRAEFNRRLETAPPYRHRPPTDAELDTLIEAYEGISGRRSSRHVIDLLVTCYRVHGPATVKRLRELHAELGTTTNLLAEVRLREPASFARADRQAGS